MRQEHRSWYIALPITAVLVCGCVEIEENLNLNVDGSGSGHITFRIDAEIAAFAGDMISQLRHNFDSAVASGAVSRWELINDETGSDGRRMLVVGYDFDDVQQLGKISGVSPQLVTDKEPPAFKMRYSFSGTGTAPLDPGVSYTLIAQLPGKVVQTNGISMNDSRVRWQFDSGSRPQVAATVERYALSPAAILGGLRQAFDAWAQPEGFVLKKPQGQLAVMIGGEEVASLDDVMFWAPRGTEIYIIRSGQDVKGTLVWSASGLRKLSDLVFFRPRLSPDGRYLLGEAFEANRGVGLKVLDVETGKTQVVEIAPVTHGSPEAMWSGDSVALFGAYDGVMLSKPGSSEKPRPTRCHGDVLELRNDRALMTGNGLFWCDLGTGQTSRISRRKWLRHVAWSPVGDRLAILTDDELLITDREGGHQLKLHVKDDLKLTPPEQGGCSPNFVQWKPNGRGVAFGFYCSNENHESFTPFWILDTVTGAVAREPADAEALSVGWVTWPRFTTVSIGTARTGFFALLALLLAVSMFFVFVVARYLVATASARWREQTARCPSCEHTVEADSRFCTHCGSRLDEIKASPVTTPEPSTSDGNPGGP